MAKGINSNDRDVYEKGVFGRSNVLPDRIRFTVQRALAILTLLAASAGDLFAAEPANNGWTLEQWNIQTSVYTRHWDPEPYHNNRQKLLSVEAEFDNHWLLGATVFENSFHQDAQLVYVGRKWAIASSEILHVKLVGGVLHGYKEPYEDKIPLNQYGIAPVLLPALGVSYRHMLLEVSFAGVAAVTITAGIWF